MSTGNIVYINYVHMQASSVSLLPGYVYRLEDYHNGHDDRNLNVEKVGEIQITSRRKIYGQHATSVQF